VQGFARGVRHREEGLKRASFSARFVRVLDALGCTRFRHWRIYGEEALARRKATLWLAAESLAVEHAGKPLFHLPGAPRSRHRRPEVRRKVEALRNLVRAAPTAAALCSGLFR
jgi:hypothetical protein